MFTSLFKHLSSRSPRDRASSARRRKARPCPATCSPHLEALESRIAPSAGHLRRPFGPTGIVTTDFTGPTSDRGGDVAIQADGKIVVVGSAGRQFALARYNSGGSLDTSFDGDGKVTTNFGGFAFASGVALQPDGKIVAVGGSGGNFALARYNSNGSLDTNFDGDGKVLTDFGGSESARAVAIQPNGKIVAAGGSFSFATFTQSFALARYNPNGSLDPSFDTDGKVTTALGGFARGVAVRPDDKIVAAGTTFNPATSTTDFTVVRYNRDGSLDGSPQRAAGGGGGAARETLTSAQLQVFLAEAVRRWQATGLDTSSLGTLQVFVADLPGDLLGLTSGSIIWLDADAAGWGWFVDATPWDAAAFTTPGDQGEGGRMDLLSVLLHEMGHVLGLGHDEKGVMQETLGAGTRLPILDEGGPTLTADLGPVARLSQPCHRPVDRPAAAGPDAELARLAAVTASQRGLVCGRRRRSRPSGGRTLGRPARGVPTPRPRCSGRSSTRCSGPGREYQSWEEKVSGTVAIGFRTPSWRALRRTARPR